MQTRWKDMSTKKRYDKKYELDFDTEREANFTGIEP
jgi:hypothetical protein